VPARIASTRISIDEGAHRHRHSGFFDLPLDPARGRPMGVLLDVADPGSGLRTATPVDGTGESAELGHVIVAAFRWLVTQRHIGLASHEVCPLS